MQTLAGAYERAHATGAQNERPSYGSPQDGRSHTVYLVLVARSVHRISPTNRTVATTLLKSMAEPAPERRPPGYDVVSAESSIVRSGLLDLG